MMIEGTSVPYNGDITVIDRMSGDPMNPDDAEIHVRTFSDWEALVLQGLWEAVGLLSLSEIQRFHEEVRQVFNAMEQEALEYEEDD